MTAWTTDELDRIGEADELSITTARPDGSLRSWVPIWVVRAGDELYVRSYRGADSAWYRHATQDGAARIRAAGVERDVTVEHPERNTQSAVDDAYQAKYARYGTSYLQRRCSPPVPSRPRCD
jgi:hypothetical protein